MKRDMNLVREILLWATDQDASGVNANPTIVGYSADQVSHHVHLMSQAGLVEAAVTTALSDPGPTALLLSVTWAGHDFVDAARDNTIWNKAKRKVLSSGSSFTFDLLKDVLVLLAKGALELR